MKTAAQYRLRFRIGICVYFAIIGALSCPPQSVQDWFGRLDAATTAALTFFVLVIGFAPMVILTRWRTLMDPEELDRRYFMAHLHYQAGLDVLTYPDRHNYKRITRAMRDVRYFEKHYSDQK